MDGFSIEANANYAGEVLVDGRQNLQPSVEACGEACLAEPACTTFVYCAKAEGCFQDFVYQSCFLKRHDNPAAREAYSRDEWTPWTSGVVERGGASGGTGAPAMAPSPSAPPPLPSSPAYSPRPPEMPMPVDGGAVQAIPSKELCHGKPIGYPNTLEPASGTYFGVVPQVYGGSVDLEQYITTFAGFAPASYSLFVNIPISDAQRLFLDEFLAQTAALGAIAIVTVEPWDGLDAVTEESIGPIVERCAFFERMRASCIIRFAHEFNGGWYPWGRQPRKYVEKFRLVSNAVRAGTEHSAVMWSANAPEDYPWGGPSDFSGNPDFDLLDTNKDGAITGQDDPFAAYWPGKDYVDWVGLSVYHWGVEYPWGPIELAPANAFLRNVAPRTLGAAGNDVPVDFYETYAVGQGKPLAISETAAYYAPSMASPGSPSELEVKRSWWAQLIRSPSGVPLRTLLPQLKLISWFDIEKEEGEVNAVVDWRVSGSPRISEPFRQEVLAAPESREFWIDLNAYHGIFPCSCIEFQTPAALATGEDGVVMPYGIGAPSPSGFAPSLSGDALAAAPVCSIERSANYRGTVIVNGHLHRTATAAECCASCFGEAPGGGSHAAAASGGAPITMTSTSLSNVFAWCADPNGCYGDFAFGECWCKWSDTPERRAAWARGPSVPWVSGVRADSIPSDRRGSRDATAYGQGGDPRSVYYYEGEDDFLDNQTPDFLVGQEPDWLGDQDYGDSLVVPYPTAQGIGGGPTQLACPDVAMRGMQLGAESMSGPAAAVRDASAFEVRPTTNFQEWHIAMNVTNPLDVPVDVGGLVVDVAYSPWQQRRGGGAPGTEFEWFPADYDEFRVVCSYAFVVDASGQFNDPRRGAAGRKPLNLCPTMHVLFEDELYGPAAISPSRSGAELLTIAEQMGGPARSSAQTQIPMNPRRHFTLVLPFGLVLCPRCSIVGDPDGVMFVLAASNGLNGLDFTRPPSAVVPDVAMMSQSSTYGMRMQSPGVLTCLKLSPEWRQVLEAQSLQAPSRQVPQRSPAVVVAAPPQQQMQVTPSGGAPLPTLGGGGGNPASTPFLPDAATASSLANVVTCVEFVNAASQPLLSLAPGRMTEDSSWIFAGDVLRSPGPGKGDALRLADASFEIAASPWVQPSASGEFVAASAADFVLECVRLELASQPGQDLCPLIAISTRDLPSSAAVFRIGFKPDAEAVLCDAPGCALRGAGTVGQAADVAFTIRHRDGSAVRLDPNVPIADEDITCSPDVTVYDTSGGREGGTLPQPLSSGSIAAPAAGDGALSAACPAGAVLACNPDGTPGTGFGDLVNLLETLPPSNTLGMGYGDEAQTGAAVFVGGTILRIDDPQQRGAMAQAVPEPSSSSVPAPMLCLAGYTVAFDLPGPIIAGQMAPPVPSEYAFRCIHAATSGIEKSDQNDWPCDDMLVLGTAADPNSPGGLLGLATFSARMSLSDGGWVVGGPNGVLFGVRHTDPNVRIPSERMTIRQDGVCVPYGPGAAMTAAG